MKLLSIILSFVLLVAALPSREVQRSQSAELMQRSSAAAANCQPGVVYCFNQIVSDLRKFLIRSCIARPLGSRFCRLIPRARPPPFPLLSSPPFDAGYLLYSGVDQQTILHQYCDQQSVFDAQSCWGCKRPFPLPNCWAGPGAWNSAFECVNGNTYTFKRRCSSWCEAGECVD